MDPARSFIGARGDGMNYSLDTNKPRAGTMPFAVSRSPSRNSAAPS